VKLLRFWHSPNRRKEDLHEEIQAHLRMATADRIDRGEPASEAREAALREFGNVALVEDITRDAWGWAWLEELAQDFRFGLRMLRKNFPFVLVVVLVLALGIGANTAVFSVINAVLLRPLPYPHSERLLFMSEWSPEIRFMYFSMADLNDFRSRSTVFESFGAFRRADATLTGFGDAERIKARQVTPDFFAALQTKPLIGRLLNAGDDNPGSTPVLVLGENMWVREFNHDRRVLGQRLYLDGEAYTVVGVVANSHWHLGWPEVDAFSSLGRWQDTPGFARRSDHHGIYVYARLKPGVTFEQAREQMWSIGRQLQQQHPDTNSGLGVTVSPLLPGLTEYVRRPLLLTMVAVGLVLLIACANVANLLTSFALTRRQEIAIRGALGAGPGRLARQFLCESILLALIGACLGLIAACVATTAVGQGLVHLAASTVPRIEEISVDRRVMLFTLAIAILTGLGFGVFPALAAYRVDPNQMLKDSGRACRSGLSHFGLRGVLVATELCLCVVLLTTTGLTIKSLLHTFQQDLGFRTEGRLTAGLALPAARYSNDERKRAFITLLLQRVSALANVQSAGFKNPLLGASESTFYVEGQPRPAVGAPAYTELSSVTPGALEAMGIHLLRGRYFNAGDNSSAEPVCIIDDQFASRYWPGESALGKHVALEDANRPGGYGAWKTVVGVVHHVQYHFGDWPTLAGTYLPYAQQPTLAGTLVVRSYGDLSSLEPALRDVLRELDPNLAFSQVQSLQARMDEDLASRKLIVLMVGILSGIALLLAALGTYGVMAHMVSGRAHEIGLRRALGAGPRDVLELVMKHGMNLALGGAAVGVVASLAIAQVMRGLLFGVSLTDPYTFAAVVVLLMAVALVACYFPARRAVNLNPLEVLRHE